MSFETSLLDGLYSAGIAQRIEAEHAPSNPNEGTADSNRGLMALLSTVQAAYMPQCLECLRPVYAKLRQASEGELARTRHGLRLRHPEVIGLREGLISSGGVCCTSVIEASWLYGDAVDAICKLPEEGTVAGKLWRLSEAFEAIVTATADRTAEGLSADDLVPLLTLAIVPARLDIGFEGFVLDALLSDLLSSGRESYIACTLAVSLGFLRGVAL